MTIKEIEYLEANSDVRDFHSLTLLIELYCTDYAKIYADNTVKLLYFQTFKLIWNNLKIHLPSIANQEGLLLIAEACKTSPDRRNFELLMKSLMRYTENSKEYSSKLIWIFNGVLTAISKNITPILNQSFGKYARGKIANSLIADFVHSPSYRAFSEMIERIEAFGNSHKELEAAKARLLSILSYIKNTEIEKFKDIKDSCYRWFQITDTLKEYNFIQKLSAATAGDKQAMLETGKNYEEGIGVEHNEHLAEEWYTKALLAGNSNAQYFITNLNTKQHQKQIEEKYNQKLSEQAELLSNLKQELKEERQKTKRLEQEKYEEIKRLEHNYTEELKLYVQEIGNLKQLLGKTKNTSTEEKMIRVKFSYNIIYRKGDSFHRNDEDIISIQTYNSLINGGEYAIANYIRSNYCDLYVGDRITNARMRKQVPD